MSTDPSLSHTIINGTLWVRCNTRGSFVNSPALKTLAEKHIEAGANTIVIDLEICQGVDSTFMGTLAGLARQCMAVGGTLQVATPTERTRSAMQNLGLDMLLELDPEDAPWRPQLAEIRSILASSNLGVEGEKLGDLDRTRHVLDAHNTLRSLNKQNEESFGYVCESLEEDLRRRTDENPES